MICNGEDDNGNTVDFDKEHDKTLSRVFKNKDYSRNLFKLISELTAKGTKDNVKANFQNNQSTQKNKNQRFLKTIVSFFIYNDQLK